VNKKKEMKKKTIKYIKEKNVEQKSGKAKKLRYSIGRKPVAVNE